MPRSVSATLKQAAFAQETGEAVLELVTLDHPDLGGPLRMVNNLTDVVSRGNTFVAFPFMLTLPAEDEDRAGEARLTIDNVSGEIAAALRSISSPATVTLEVVLASSPDTVEASAPDYQLRDVTIDVGQVSGRLTLEDFESEPYPAGRMSPLRFPGLF